MSTIAAASNALPHTLQMRCIAFTSSPLMQSVCERSAFGCPIAIWCIMLSRWNMSEYSRRRRKSPSTKYSSSPVYRARIDTASSSSMTLDSAATSPLANRNLEQKRCTLPTNTSPTPLSAMLALMRSSIPRAARLVNVRHSMSAYSTPSTSWARRMRSVSICVLPQPGEASTRWNPPCASITSRWYGSGVNVSLRKGCIFYFILQKRRHIANTLKIKTSGCVLQSFKGLGGIKHIKSFRRGITISGHQPISQFHSQFVLHYLDLFRI